MLRHIEFPFSAYYNDNINTEGTCNVDSRIQERSSHEIDYQPGFTDS